MKRFILSALLCLGLGLTSHGQDKSPAAAKATVHEKIAIELMDVLAEMNDIILTATDLQSSKKAAESIVKLQAKVDAIAERLKPIEPPSNEEKKAIEAKMKAHHGTVDKAMGDRLLKTMLKLSDRSQNIISKAMRKFHENLDKHDEIFSKHFKPAE